MDIKRITIDSDNLCQSKSGIIECTNGNIYEISASALDKISNIIDEFNYNLDDLPLILRVIYRKNKPLLASKHNLLTNKSYELTCICCRYRVSLC
jgi:hypothetical protein